MIRSFRRSGRNPISRCRRANVYLCAHRSHPAVAGPPWRPTARAKPGKAMFAKLGEADGGRTPVRLHAAGQSEKEDVCGVA